MNESDITEAVKESFLGLVEAAQSLDLESYFSFFAPEKFTSLNADGTVTSSFSDFENQARQEFSGLLRYKSLTFHNIEISVIDESNAILVNEYDAEVILKSGQEIVARGAGAQVWSFASGQWKLVHVSSSAPSQ